MKGLLVYLAVVSIALGLVVTGCTQAAPPPSPTAATAPKVAEPTKAPAAEPTAVPAKKVDFPAKGKTISVIVPWNPGGDGDRMARSRAPLLEKELGIPVQVVNKAGASGQVGVTEFVQAPADGYTILSQTLEITIASYLDPERKTIYKRKDFSPLGYDAWDPATITVQATSPWKTVKDVVDAAKANPEKITAGTSGIQTLGHLALLQLQQFTGAKFAITHFEGSAKELPGLLGGHIEVGTTLGTVYRPQHQAGGLRILAIADDKENPMYSGVPTLRSQGYDVFLGGTYGMYVRSEVPEEIQDILAKAFQKIVMDSEHQSKIGNMGYTYRYTNASEAAKFFEQMEKQLEPLIPLSRE